MSPMSASLGALRQRRARTHGAPALARHPRRVGTSVDVVRLPGRSWDASYDAGTSERCASVLEHGGLVVMPELAFALAPGEERFLDVLWLSGDLKNVSLDGRSVSGSTARGRDRDDLCAMIGRFASGARSLVENLLPGYAPHVRLARTSFRPVPVEGRVQSPREDDRRLHVDAFPSRPNRGERILRVFCNVNPHGLDRVWRVGEPFEAMAARFLPSIRRMWPGEAALLAAMRVTRTRRSEYDHAMLALHDLAKFDADYQQTSPQQEVRFAPGTTWLCFSDQVMHAATSGQHMMEQTLHLPLAAMRHPAASPLATLERLTGRAMR